MTSRVLTFEVRPPLSGDCKIAFKVLKNLGSDYTPPGQPCPYLSHTRADLVITTHWGGEEHERHDEERRVEDLQVFVALREELLVRVPGLLHDLFVELVARRVPLGAPRAGQRPFLCESDA